MNESKALLKLIKCFLEDEKYKIDENLDEEKLYQLAQKNKVSNFLYQWSQSSCQSENIKQLIGADYHKQIIKDTNENLELENILNRFEEAGIETLVVKGVTMKEVYSKPYMRQMCDIDLMLHDKDFKKASKIMKDLGFEEFYDHEKHLVFTKNSLILVEVHRKLIPGADTAHEYFNDIWPLCIAYQNYQHVYRMDLEDTYLFCIIHLIRHFKYAGIEIRDVLDVYLFYQKYKNDFQFEKLNQKLAEFEAKEFEENIRRIAYKWFGNEEIEDFDEVERFILKGSSIENNIHYAVGEKHGKSSYVLQLFFPKYKIMKEKYPILKKVPVLLPATWVARLIKDVFSKETTVKARMDKIKLIQEANPEEVAKIQDIYQKLGIIRKDD